MASSNRPDIPDSAIALLATACFFWSGGALSQTAQTEAPLISLHGHEANFTVGVGVGYAAKYPGADEYTSSPMPILSLQYGPFFLDPVRGLGVEYASEGGFSAGLSIQYDQGRKDEDDLQGMGKVKSSGVLDLAVSQALSEWMVVDAGVSARVSGQKDRGNQYRLGLTFIPYQTDQDVFTVGANVEMGDKDYNQTYFGVTPAQAGRTRFRTFTPESGVHAQNLQLGWSRMLDKHWTLDASAGVTKLGSKVKKSPIVFDDVNYSVNAGVTYTF